MSLKDYVPVNQLIPQSMANAVTKPYPLPHIFHISDDEFR